MITSNFWRLSTGLILGIAFASSNGSVAAAPSTHRENNDYLVPVNGVVSAAYERLLNRKLYQTAANYLRVVVLTSTGTVGERAFSLHSTGTSPERVSLTYTQADENIWSAAFALDTNLTKEPRVNVRRMDVPFPKHLAVLLADRIGQMVHRRKTARSTDRVVIDGTDIVFVINDHKGETSQARLASESEGRNSRALRNIKDLLRNYCESKASDRSPLAKRIEGEVKALGGEQKL